eukprot:TRINITY_DN3326_c0_g1_i1.p1 TRINITY_DN3326_c0_g1~~TRINITY_DN3326_c0_g1_i1.p1  ORF type:complete len:855 (-),score=346.35 TRINITY_DN3326_c0_g1_i1:122-2686(-)
MGDSSTIRIPPFKYIHVLDNIVNVTRIEIGPQTYVRRDHELVVTDPTDFVKLAPRTYVKIADPAIFKDGKPEQTEFGQVKNRFGDVEIRTSDSHSEPFPLYPNERLIGRVEKYIVVQQNTALKLVALRDFEDSIAVAGKTVSRKAGDEWVRVGPFTYIPRIEEEIVTVINAQVIRPNTALKLSAEKDLVDALGNKRKVNEKWLIRETGSYLPRLYERVEGIVQGVVLTDKKAIKLRAINDFVDVYKKKRRAGEEWLVTTKLAQVHIPDVYEEDCGIVSAYTLSNRQYCIVHNPIDENGRNHWGARELRKGELTFFPGPGEELEDGVQEIIVLGEDEALLLAAREEFTDDQKKTRKPGEKWMIIGPREYIPSVEVIVVEKRKSIPLDEKEGIYIRDNNTGEVRTCKGSTYLLKAHESLWEKELPPAVEELIALQKMGQAYVPPKINDKGELVYDVKEVKNYRRDKTKVVTFRVPHNTAVQLFDYKNQKTRVVFGPELVMLEPDEHFTVISLSGGKPKREGVIKSLALNLGPDFMTDVVFVETLDHAKLSLQLSYNWHFSYDKNKIEDCQKLFSVKDFVGDACKSIASRVRGAVSAISFEDFHTKSSTIIRSAVFGYNQDGSFREEFKIVANNLVITSVDIQSVEPVDPKTRESLEKSVTLAIEITTKSQEAAAKHQAERMEQEAKGELERQTLEDLSKAEEAKKKLLELQAQSASIASSGQAIAEARAKAESKKIEGEAEVKQAELRAKAFEIENSAEIERQQKEQEAEVQHKEALYELEVQKAQQLAEIETAKFKQVIAAIGRETLVAISKAGPEMKAKLLSGLGLKGYLVTDGKNPINLMNTANGFLGTIGQN